MRGSGEGGGEWGGWKVKEGRVGALDLLSPSRDFAYQAFPLFSMQH